MWKTDYLGIHEKRYQKLKAEGQTGWSGERSIRDILTWIDKAVLRHGSGYSGTVLELGCGAGDVTMALTQRGFHGYGIDIAPTAVFWAHERARINHIQAHFQRGNVLDLPYRDNAFDLVVDELCLHCLIGSDRHRFLSEALRVLKPAGLFLVMTMCHDPTDSTMRHYFDPESRNVIANGIAGRHYGLPNVILADMRAAGFHLNHWEIDMADASDPQDDLIVEATKIRSL